MLYFILSNEKTSCSLRGTGRLGTGHYLSPGGGGGGVGGFWAKHDEI